MNFQEKKVTHLLLSMNLKYNLVHTNVVSHYFLFFTNT